MQTELSKSVISAAANRKYPVADQAFVAYRIQRRDFFQGKHLKHVQTSPWYIRLILYLLHTIASSIPSHYFR